MLSLVGVGYVQGFGCAIILQDTAERGGQRRNQNTVWSGFLVQMDSLGATFLGKM